MLEKELDQILTRNQSHLADLLGGVVALLTEEVCLALEVFELFEVEGVSEEG